MSDSNAEQRYFFQKIRFALLSLRSINVSFKIQNGILVVLKIILTVQARCNLTYHRMISQTQLRNDKI